MEQKTQHVAGEPKGPTNPVPTIQQDNTNGREQAAVDVSKIGLSGSHASTTNNVSVTPPAAQQAQSSAAASAPSEVDPITGKKVDLKTFANVDMSKQKEKDLADVVGGSNNLLFYKFPPPDWNIFKSQTNALISKFLAFIIIETSILRFFSKGYISVFFSLAFVVGGGYYVQQQVDRFNQEALFGGSEAQRGEKALEEEIPESAEWMNAFLKTLWPIINPDMFASSADMIEDIMQSSLPKFIKMVKVKGIHQGVRGMRLLNVKTLKDSEFTEVERLREQKLAEEEKNSLRKLSGKAEQETTAAKAGKYVNLELTLAYHSTPTQNPKRPQNPSLQIEFFLGAIGQTIRFPVWAEILELLVTVRLRLQLTPDPPFLKNLTFAFTTIPKVGVSVLPMSRSLPNVVDLPVIKGLVQGAVETAMKEFMVPKSMTIDVGAILSGDGIKKRLDTWGIVLVRIIGASNLHPQDKAGKSDPYFLLSFSKFAKPLHATRVIEKTLNPIYEETAALLIRTDEVKADESVKVELWDSDRFSEDDKIARIEIPLRQLIMDKGKTMSLNSPLMSYKDEGDVGTLNWELTFYDIRGLNDALKTDGTDPRIPKELLEKNPELKAEGVVKANDSDVMCIPPDPEFPSGVISVIVHQIVDLGEHKAKSTYGKGKNIKVGQEEQGEGILEEEGENSPSSYCKIFLNDEAIYKTRVKAFTANPFFNAGTEKYLPDWRSAKVAVAVMESEEEGSDKLMGTVQLDLAEELRNSSCVSNFYSISNGNGFGKIKISILFRSIDAKLPKNLLNFNLGTVEVLNDVQILGEPAGLDKMKIKFKVWDLSKSFEPSTSDGAIWATKGLQIPVTNRGSAMLWVVFKKKSKLAGFAKKVYAVANCRLSDVPDDTPTDLELTIVLPKSGPGDDSTDSESEDDLSEELKDKQTIGKIRVSLIFHRGRTTAHTDDKQAKEALTDPTDPSAKKDDAIVASDKKKTGLFGKLKSKALPKLDGQSTGVETEA